MIATKICGITRKEDALLTTELGAAAVGFVFYSGSPRYIAPEQAAGIIEALPSGIAKVGVFVNEGARRISATARVAGLTMVQLSGDESPADCAGLDLPVIKTFHVNSQINSLPMDDYPVQATLLDTSVPGKYGGTGQPFEWSQVNRAAITLPLIASGGLNPDNVLDAVEVLQPDAIDLSSGVETAPGQKDAEKLRRLFAILQDCKPGERPVFRS
ncbi:MAG: phosphoribosylanthranilate isomerase [Candidatus Marinimicrobia bacterium]|nr:phosphoribosylanthranilate isomerase [Candidatus Neomarinimicrobiota bacterium]